MQQQQYQRDKKSPPELIILFAI